MNAFRSTLLLICLIPLGTATWAAEAAAPAKSPAAKAQPNARSPGELAALEQFLNLSDAELAQLQDVIARIRAMTPAERAALREEIAAFRQLPERQRMQLRQGWGMMPPEIQDGWREMMQNTTAEEHAQIQKKMQSLTSPEERMRYRRELVEAYLKAKAAKK